MTATAQRLEVDRNYDYFQRNLPSFIAEHRGDYALLRNASVEGFFTSVSAAFAAGQAKFGHQPFSVQEVTDQPIDLGFFSCFEA